ncbi:flippase [Salibacterium halotolerans]|uniref:flippase n=1 Tax=Salibacterium halotolerans TaxID=1884432 RepID=UPI00244ECD2D|nr:flippase [Salibacterium halotolerans]
MLTVIRQTLSILLGVMIIILLARVLGPDGQGKYTLLILLPNMLSTLLNMGINAASVYYIGRKLFSIETIYKTNVIISLFLSLISILLGIAFALLLQDSTFSNINISMVVVSLAALPFLYLNKILQSLFQGKEDFQAFNLIVITRQLTTLILMAALVYIVTFGVMGALIAFILGQLITTVLVFYMLKKRLGVKWNQGSFSNQYTKDALRFGLKAHLSNVLAFINYRADVLIISFFLTPALVGIYTVAVNIAEKLWTVSQSVSAVLYPRISSISSENEKNELTAVVGKTVLLLSFIVCAILFIFSESIVHLLFGHEYNSSIVVLKILLPGIVLFSLDKILSNDLAGRGRPIINLYTSLLTVLINVSLNLYLIPQYGINGSAFATSFSYALTLFIKLIVYKKETKLEIKKIILINKTDWNLYKQFVYSILSMRGKKQKL